MQIFDESTAAQFDFDILDATKIVPEDLVPLRRVGRKRTGKLHIEGSNEIGLASQLRSDRKHILCESRPRPREHASNDTQRVLVVRIRESRLPVERLIEDSR